ncbi:MAG: site-specific integrase [Chloroflexi bacterium]|nr:site-specific integrase [Chloroflexota bacterium]
MASYEKDNKTGLWSVRYWVDGLEGRKQRRKSGFSTKIEAQRYHAAVMIESSESTDISMTLDTLFDLYLKHSVGRIKNSTRDTFTRDYNAYIKSYFGSKKVVKITTKDIRQWQTHLISKELSHTYVVKIQRIFSIIINFGIKYYDLDSNPIKKCDLPRDTSPHKEMDFWTEDEFKRFIESVDELLWRSFFSFLYLTGCRRGEALAITWQDINNGAVKIHKHVNTKGVDGYEITSPKNPSSVRTVLLPDTLVAHLAAFKKECEQIDGWSEGAFVFGVHRPLALSIIQRKLTSYAQKAGVKRIRVHDLRHSHASLLIHKGCNILVVAQRLGHTDINRTLNTYSHLYPSAQKDILNLINISF